MSTQESLDMFNEACDSSTPTVNIEHDTGVIALSTQSAPEYASNADTESGIGGTTVDNPGAAVINSAVTDATITDAAVTDAAVTDAAVTDAAVADHCNTLTANSGVIGLGVDDFSGSAITDASITAANATHLSSSADNSHVAALNEQDTPVLQIHGSQNGDFPVSATLITETEAGQTDSQSMNEVMNSSADEGDSTTSTDDNTLNGLDTLQTHAVNLLLTNDAHEEAADGSVDGVVSDSGMTIPASKSDGGVTFVPFKQPNNSPSMNEQEENGQADLDWDFKFTPQHFLAINPDLFHGAEIPDDLEQPKGGEYVLQFLDTEVHFHRAIIRKSAMLNAAFTNKMQEGLSGIMKPKDSDELNVWLIVLLAMYGEEKLPPNYFKKFEGVLIVNALQKADYILATAEVNQSLAKILNSTFSKVHVWKQVLYAPLTVGFHQELVEAINETYLAYRALVIKDKPFTDASFAVALALMCPFEVYSVFEDRVHEDLVRGVAKASVQISNGIPFDSATCKLFA
ncbi:hypothetical protein BJ170DRAFT_724915 [Xylariales sp. AK1849]|nr:hypothetical protein BJ170DRAFT_724915 [Xylariales sp. AK1849]